MAVSLLDYIEILKRKSTGDAFDVDYHLKHAKRFEQTKRLLDAEAGNSVLEIGATDYFPMMLSEIGYTDIWGTIFSDDPLQKFYTRRVEAVDGEIPVSTLSVDIEKELFPVDAGHFDLVIFCEVLEHLDIDPMFALSEFNRILKIGGKIILTTPNCCSARNLWKILHGFRPHFFMQYEISRSPFRHNFEHDVHSVTLLLESAGFSIEKIFTVDVFEEPVRESLDFLDQTEFEKSHRGDDIFVVARKIGPVTNRWPAEFYV